MPFVSKRQRRYLFKNNPELAIKWADETPAKAKLPEKVKKSKPKRR